MAVTKASFIGQINGTGGFNSTWADQTALFLKVFAGEVLQTFETEAVMKPLHMVRTIQNGKSAQFPVTGIATASYHVPGQDILTEAGSTYSSAIKMAEKVINIDDLLIATTFIDKLDEARNHYDVRSIYSSELGRALAKQFDKNLIGLAALAAATYNASTGVPTARGANIANVTGAGTVITPSSSNNSTDRGNVTVADLGKFVDSMYDMAAAFDAKNVPSSERYCLLTPTSYYRLINSTEGRNLLNRDYGNEGNGQGAKAVLLEIAGFRIIKSNNAVGLIGTDASALSNGNNGSANGGVGYMGNFSRVMGVCFQKGAIGTVKLMDLSMESDYDIRLQGNLMVAKYAMGHGLLRPECAGVITSAT
jgi:hypothetical protein